MNFGYCFVSTEARHYAFTRFCEVNEGFIVSVVANTFCAITKNNDKHYFIRLRDMEDALLHGGRCFQYLYIDDAIQHRDTITFMKARLRGM